MTSMKERAAIGTKWVRRRDKTVWTIWQSHRSDRIAELRPLDDAPVLSRRVFVSFTDLRQKFEEVGP